MVSHIKSNRYSFLYSRGASKGIFWEEVGEKGEIQKNTTSINHKQIMKKEREKINTKVLVVYYYLGKRRRLLSPTNLSLRDRPYPTDAQIDPNADCPDDHDDSIILHAIVSEDDTENDTAQVARCADYPR